MTEASSEPPTSRPIPPGTAVCFLVAFALLVLAGYFVFAPIRVMNGTHALDCGSLVSKPASELARGICGSSPSALARTRAISLAVAALLVAGGGMLVFGVPRSATKGRSRRAARRSRRGEADAEEQVVTPS
jgi:hypothetical protein